MDVLQKTKLPNFYNVNIRPNGPIHGFAVRKNGVFNLYYYDYNGINLENTVDPHNIPSVYVRAFKTLRELNSFVIKSPNASLKNRE
jgi:hypothetical protein